MDDGSAYVSKDDPRITRIGKFIRETSIDELPQLINVLIGQMSLIGPRPDLVSNNEYPEEYKSVFSVRPGLTGYNQAYYRNEVNWSEKLKNDLYYVEKISFCFDLKILLKTI
jgi:lipopolysaccharide/colanic/teichoic acid biosynthesis glycosyltransferase